MVVRRSGNYQPSLWDDTFLQSLNSDYKSNVWENHRLEKLKEYARNLLEEAASTSAQLELIDEFQRLGIGYHFELEIEEILNTISTSIGNHGLSFKDDLYITSLCFRLLRQNSYKISKDVFNVFMDEMGCFNKSLCRDVKGLLSLYEASHLGFVGETIMDEAKAFAVEQLKDMKVNLNEGLAKQVEHSLEYPLHWRVPRLESRWYIEFYERKDGMNPILLDFSKMDFNMVQAIYQSDLKKTDRWWRNLGLGNKLSFSRDFIVECFLWTVGITFEPRSNHCREELTKVIQLVTTIDDIYDVYGLLDELELFTEAVDRWDTSATENLPEYMKICYLALYNTVNEMGYNIQKEGVNIIPYLKRSWTDLCKAYLTEAKWQQSGYQPTLEEYLNNAWISVAGPVVLTHAYFSMDQKITKEGLESIEKKADIIRRSSMIVRLADDLGTSTKELQRGDVPKSIQCYMHETGASELTAREYVKGLINETWKKMNGDLMEVSIFPKPFISAAVNVARMAQCIYQNGDGFGAPNAGIVKSLLIEPIFT